MTADPIIIREGSIAHVRIRLGWRGQPVMQVKRNQSRHRLGGISLNGSIEDCGTTQWRDAKKADAIELSQFLIALKRPPPPYDTDRGGNYGPPARSPGPPGSE